MKHLIKILIVLILPTVVFAKTIDIVPNTFSPEQFRATEPFVMTIDGHHEIRDSQAFFALGLCYQRGNEVLRAAIVSMIEPDPADTTPIDQQFFSIATSLASEQRLSPEKFRFVTTHLSSLSPALKASLEACLN